MTKEIGRELEFPKTYYCVNRSYPNRRGHTYPHGSNKVCLPLLETKSLRHANGNHVGNECLDQEDNGDNRQLNKLVSSQLRCQFRENYVCQLSKCVMLMEPTQARCEQGNVQVCHELLLVGIEHALPSDYVPW